ncbi:hypothetical protein [Streptomyces sp. NPDC001811]
MYMPSRTRALRFTAVLTLVVLSLTGFSSGRHHGSRGHGGGGGGCSSSHQDHDSSSSTSGGGSYGSSGGSSYGSDDDGYGSTGGGSYRRTHRPTSTPSGNGRTPLKDGTARLVACARAGKPYATVEVTNPNGRKATFRVEVLFLPQTPPAIDSARTKVSVPAHGTRTVRLPFEQNAHLDLLDHCEVDRTALLAS